MDKFNDIICLIKIESTVTVSIKVLIVTLLVVRTLIMIDKYKFVSTTVLCRIPYFTVF